MNQGWFVEGANFSWTPASGGTPQGIQIDWQNGFLGALQNMQIVPKVHALPAGQYQGWLTVAYNTKPPQPTPTLIISTVVQFTVQ